MKPTTKKSLNKDKKIFYKSRIFWVRFAQASLVIITLLGVTAAILIMRGDMSIQSFAKNGDAWKDRVLKKNLKEAKDNKSLCSAKDIRDGKHLKGRCIIKGQQDLTVNELVNQPTSYASSDQCDKDLVPKCNSANKLTSCEKNARGVYVLTYRTLSADACARYK